VHSFAVLEPMADGFRNYLSKKAKVPAEEFLIDRAQLMTLTAPEMTVLVGGMRALGANAGGEKHGYLMAETGVLTNEFFTNLLGAETQWEKAEGSDNLYIGRDMETGQAKWTGTRADLVFGSNSQLRGLSEVYGSADAKERFVKDFVAAWDKVMNLDRFDIKA
jgi:catalase-peroxidase